MTVPITLQNVTTFTNDTTAATTVNNNSAAIVTALGNALDTAGDKMLGTLDANSNRILNLPLPISGQEPLRLTDASVLNGGGTITAGLTSVGLTLPADYTVTGSPLTNNGSITASYAVTPQGTGAFVKATSPTLTTPNIGTPSAGTLTNCTNLPISTGISGLAAGVSTFLATPSSANLRSALTDEVGTGAAYFVGGALGTPASGNLTNCTGLFQARQTFFSTGINFNSANTDTSIPITLPAGFTKYMVNFVRIYGASASISTATAGIFTAAAAGGTTVCANQALTVTSSSDATANNMMNVTITNVNVLSFTLASFPTLFFRVGTAQGSAATANVSIEVLALP